MPISPPPADIVALLDLALERIEGIQASDNRRLELRSAIGLLNQLVEAVRAAGPDRLPEGFLERADDARHCLTMGKPQECVAMIRRLQNEMSRFWTE